MIHLKMPRNYGDLENDATMFDGQYELLYIWIILVSVCFIASMLCCHHLDYLEDFIIFHGGKDSFFSMSIRESSLCYAARIWIQGVHLHHCHAKNPESGYLFCSFRIPMHLSLGWNIKARKCINTTVHQCKCLYWRMRIPSVRTYAITWSV